MKKAREVLFGAIFALTILSGSSYAAEKIGFVELSLIFREYGKTKNYDKALSEKQNLYETERNKKINDIKQFQDKINLLSDKEKEAKKPEMETKVKAVQDYDRQKQTDLRKEQDEKMKEVLKDIEETVKKYSEKEGYTLVFNDRVLVYQDKKLDITGKIIEILNSEYKKE